MPGGLAFGTASDDSSMKLFDLRSYARLNEFECEDVQVAAMACSFSASGRLLFGGYDDMNCYAWDTLVEGSPQPVYTLMAHANRVSCVGVNRTGQAVATGSWDTDLMVRGAA